MNLSHLHDRIWHHTRAAQQIFVEFPSSSNGKFPRPGLGTIAGGESPVATASICYFHPKVHKASATFRHCFLLMLSFQPFLTFCLGKSQGNSTLLLEFLPT